MTGSDSGIGRAICVHYAKEGANVAIAYWKASAAPAAGASHAVPAGSPSGGAVVQEHSDAEVVKKECEEAGVETLLLPGDVSTEEVCKCGPAPLTARCSTC